MTATVTHIVQASKVLRYLQNHHAAEKKNRRHAVVATPRGVYEGARVETACGAEVAVEDNGYALTCWKVQPDQLGDVNCKDCRKKLAL